MKPGENPSGVGLYIRKLTKARHGTPAQLAKKLADHNISFVVIMHCWQDRNGHTEHNKNTLEAYAEACIARGVAPLIWGYPWQGMEEKFIESVSRHVPYVYGVLPDPELGYKWGESKDPTLSFPPPGGMRGDAEATGCWLDNTSWSLTTTRALELMSGIVNVCSEQHCIGVTSYGIPKYHPCFPWNVFTNYGFLSPQFYNMLPFRVERGIEQWTFHHSFRHSETVTHPPPVFLPSFSVYGELDGAELEGYLEPMVAQFPGIIGWSYRQVDSFEWKILSKVGERYQEDR